MVSLPVVMALPPTKTAFIGPPVSVSLAKTPLAPLTVTVAGNEPLAGATL